MPPKKVSPRGKGASAPKKSPTPSSPQGKKTKKTASKKKPSTSGTRYVRSLYGSDARITLDNGLVLNLKPRGQVGDLAPVDADDRADQKYALNKNLLFEEVSAAEAKQILEKQATNAQAPRNTTFDLLQNERGESYAQDAPVIEEPFENQGTVVANVEDTGSGRFSEKNTELTRPPGAAPEQASPPGSVGNPGPQIPSDVPPEQHADWLARNSGGEDAAADQLRGSLKSSVAPVQKDIDPSKSRRPVHPDEVGQ